MNRMRFGAVLVSADGKIGFYLSRRVVLTVPRSGTVRAVSFEQFGQCRAFARAGVSVSCFDAMMRAAETREKFKNSLEMIKYSLEIPEKTDFAFLCSYMMQKHGADMEDFEVKNIQDDPDDRSVSIHQCQAICLYTSP